MPLTNQKVTDLTEKTTAPVDAWLHFIDKGDVSQDPSGSSYKISKLNYLKEITADVIKSAPFLGAITPTSTHTATTSAYWLATQAGTYTNFGSVVVAANSFAIISRDANGVYSISQTALDISGKVNVSDVQTNVLAANTTNPVTGKAVADFVADAKKNQVIWSYGTPNYITEVVGGTGKPAFTIPSGIIMNVKQTNGITVNNYLQTGTFEFSGSYKVYCIDLTQGVIQSASMPIVEKSYNSVDWTKSDQFIPIAWLWDATASTITFSPLLAKHVKISKVQLNQDVWDYVTASLLPKKPTQAIVWNKNGDTKITVSGLVVTVPDSIRIQLSYTTGNAGYFKLPTSFAFSGDYKVVGINLSVARPTNNEDVVTLIERSLFDVTPLDPATFYIIASKWNGIVVFNPDFLQFVDNSLLMGINTADFKWTSNKQLNLSDAVTAKLNTTAAILDINPNAVIKNYMDLSHTVTGATASNWASDGGTVTVVPIPTAFKSSSSIKNVLKYSFSTANPLRLRTVEFDTYMLPLQTYLKANPTATVRLEMEIYTVNANVANRFGLRVWASDNVNNGFTATTTPSSVAGKQVIKVDVTPPTSMVDWSNLVTLKVWADTTVGTAEDIYIGNMFFGVLEADNLHNSVDGLKTQIANLPNATPSRKGKTTILLSGDSTFQMQSLLGQTEKNVNTNWVGLIQERFMKEKGTYINPLATTSVISGGGSVVDDYVGKTPTYSPIVLANGLLGNTRKITGVNSSLEFSVTSNMVNVVIAKDKLNTNAGIIGVYSDNVKIGEINTTNQYFKTKSDIVLTGDGVTKDFDLGDINIDVTQILNGANTYNRFTHIGYENDVDYALTTLNDSLGTPMEVIVYKKGVSGANKVNNWLRFRTAPVSGNITVKCQKAKYIEYADSNITDSLEQIGTRDRGALQARKTNQDAVYSFYLGSDATHTVKLKIESGSGLPYLWFQGAYTANMDFISFGNGGGRVTHWLGDAGSQTEFYPNENIKSELSYNPDILITGYGTNDHRSDNEFLAFRTVTLSGADVAKLNGLNIQSVVANGANWDVKLRNSLINSIGFDTVQSNNFIGNTAIVEGSIVIVGTFRWSAYNCQERIVRSFDSTTGTITVDKAWNADEIEQVNGYRAPLSALIGQEIMVRNWNGFERRYNEAISQYREKSPTTKIYLTSMALHSYRLRNTQGMDTLIKRIASNRDCGFIDLKKPVWEMDKAQTINWSQALTANSSQSFVLNQKYIEFPEVTLNGAKYNDCYIDVRKGYQLSTATAISENSNGQFGAEAELFAELVFIGTPPASGSIVVKGLTSIWATDYTHPYGTSKASFAYAEAVSKAINSASSDLQLNVCRYETNWMDIAQGQQVSIVNYAGTDKAKFEIVVADSSFNVLTSTPYIDATAKSVGVSKFSVTKDVVLIQAGNGGIGNLLTSAGVPTIKISGKFKIKFL